MSPIEIFMCLQCASTAWKLLDHGMNIRGFMEFVHCCCFMLFGLLHQAEPQKTKPDEIQALAWNLGARGTTAAHVQHVTTQGTSSLE
jgi:hypothetical protein